MKNIFTILAMAAGFSASAQVYIGPGTTMTVKGGTTLMADSMMIIPTSDLTMSNLTITHTSTPVPSMTGASVNRVYNLSSPITTDGTIGLYYTDAELNGNTASLLEIATNNAGIWTTSTGSTVNLGAHLVTNNFASPVTVQKMTATASATPLPVILVDFHAVAEGTKGLLYWDITNGEEVVSFDVERSADAVHFNAIGSMNEVSGQTQYRLYDEQPIAGMNYYRLIAHLTNGNILTSVIRTLDFRNMENGSVVIYPQPATDVLHVRLGQQPGSNATIRIADVSGKVVYQSACTELETSVNVSTFAAGVYSLTFSDDRMQQTFKVEKL